MHSQKSNSVPFAYIFHLCVKHTRSFLKFTPVIELTSNLALSHQVLKIISKVFECCSIKKTKMFLMTLEQTLLVLLCFLSSKSYCVQKIKIYFFDEITVMSGKKLPRFHGFKFNLASCFKATHLVSSHLFRKTSDFYLRNSDVALIFPFITGLIAQCTCLFRFSTVV